MGRGGKRDGGRGMGRGGVRERDRERVGGKDEE